MRVPCSRCGRPNPVEAGAASFTCGCGALNHIRSLSSPLLNAAAGAAILPVVRQPLQMAETRVKADRPGAPRRSWSGSGILQKALVSLLALAAISSVVHQGTFATFNATTSQATNTFSTGTVTMTNVAGTVIAGSNCAVSTANGTCATIFGAGNTGALKPSSTDIANTVTITYTGSLSPTTDFRLYGANYTAKTGSSTAQCTAPASGAGNPATVIDLLVTVGAASPALLYPAQNTTTTTAIASGATVTSIAVNATTAALASGAQVILYTAGTYQQFTTSAAVSSGATAVPVVSQLASATFGIGTQLAPQGTLDQFAATYTSTANGLQPKGGTNGSGVAGAWATNDNSIFNIKVHLDVAAGNTFQGCQSQSDLVWYAVP